MRTPRQTAHETPSCVIAQMAFGCLLRTRTVPEAQIQTWAYRRWTVLIRDSDVSPKGKAA